MANGLISLQAKNFRRLADTGEISLGPLNVFFGSNGAGKTTLLDTFRFVCDCAIESISMAAAVRNQGVGLVWAKSKPRDLLSVTLSTSKVSYHLAFGFVSGRLDRAPSERLIEVPSGEIVIDRQMGQREATLYELKTRVSRNVNVSGDLVLDNFSRYAYDKGSVAEDVKSLIALFGNARMYNSRDAILTTLRRIGSSSGSETTLQPDGQNLWSVLRNLHDRRDFDERYQTIIDFMRDAFPTFSNILLEQTGPSAVYAQFKEKGLRNLIPVANVSDGHLQMLLHLTALFDQLPQQETIIMFDEPEASLHPYALAVLVKAMREASEKWRRQIFVATHSPALLSHFATQEIFTVEIGADDATVIRRVSEIAEVADLVNEYSIGALYMAEAIAAQNKTDDEGSSDD